MTANGTAPKLELDRLRIEPGQGKAGRTFEVKLLFFARADFAWPQARSETQERIRPAVIAWVGSLEECRAFTANARSGRRILLYGAKSNDFAQKARIELLRSAGYRFVEQRVAGGEGLVSIAYLPRLLEIDPGDIGETVSFLFCPPTWWVRREALAHQARHGGTDVEARDAVLATYLAAYLDRRTTVPLLNHHAFHLRLWRSARRQPWWFRHDARTPLYKPCVFGYYPTEYVGDVERPRFLGIEGMALIHVEPGKLNAWIQAELRDFLQGGGLPPDFWDRTEPAAIEPPTFAAHPSSEVEKQAHPALAPPLPLPTDGQQLGLFQEIHGTP